jgi:uncharacterized phage protein (TIGR02218 family)
MDEVRHAEVKRLSRIWKLTRKDGVVKRFTNSSSEIVAATSFDAFTTETFTPSEISANRESSRRTVGLDAETDSIASIISESGWTIEDARIGLFERVRVDVWDVNWLRPQGGWLYHAVYYMVDVTFSGESISFRLATVAQLADAKVGRIYTIRCDATLGDSRCGKDLTGLSSGTKTITAVGDSPRLSFESDNTSQADDYWTDGVLTWISGTNAITGVNKHQVKLSRQTDGVMELWTTTPYDIEVGDTFSVTPGCNKLFNQHCRIKFSNQANHRGFRFVAGFDKTIAGPDAVV